MKDRDISSYAEISRDSDQLVTVLIMHIGKGEVQRVVVFVGILIALNTFSSRC